MVRLDHLLSKEHLARGRVAVWWLAWVEVAALAPFVCGVVAHGWIVDMRPVRPEVGVV